MRASRVPPAAQRALTCLRVPVRGVPVHGRAGSGGARGRGRVARRQCGDRLRATDGPAGHVARGYEGRRRVRQGFLVSRLAYHGRVTGGVDSYTGELVSIGGGK